MLSDSSDNGDMEIHQKWKRQQSEDVIDVDGRDDSDDIQVLDGSAILATPTKRPKLTSPVLTSGRSGRGAPGKPKLKLAIPPDDAPLEDHFAHLEAWCVIHYDNGANRTNSEYERPRLATEEEVVRAKGTGEKPVKYWLWRCRHCRVYTSLKLAKNAGSHTGLSNHITRCNARPENKTDGMIQGRLFEKKPIVNSEPLLAETRHAIIVWMAQNGHPFTVVDQPGFKEMFTRSFPAMAAVLPSRKMVKDDLQRVHNINRERLGNHLSQHPGVFHISTDGWTDRSGNAFIGIICNWTEVIGTTVKPRSVLIDFASSPERHTGEALAEVMNKSLRSWHIHQHVLTIVCDNASANDVMIDKLADNDWARFNSSSKGRVRCFAHILNLVTGAIIEGATGHKWSSEEAIEVLPDDDHSYGSDDQEEMEAEIWPTASQIAPDQSILDSLTLPMVPAANSAGQEIKNDQSTLSGALYKSRLLAKRLKYRSEYKRRWNEAIENLVAAKILKPGSTYTIPIDVQTRWNSTFHCLQAISNAQDVLKEFYSLLPSKQISGEEKLVAADLGLINEMIPILKLLHICTKRFSTGVETNIENQSIAGVIPVMDTLTVAFDRFSSRNTVSPAVKHGIQRGQNLLDKYYSKTDETVMYRVAILLHPAYRVKWMRKQKWEESWILEATRVGYEMWEKHYASQSGDLQRQSSASNIVMDELAMFLAESSQQGQEHANEDEDEDVFHAFVNGERTELSQHPFNGQALTWWAHQSGKDGLRQMAIDVLSCPGTSVAVERAFSKAGLMISSRRSRLAPATSTTQMLVGDWAKNGILSEKSFVAGFKSGKEGLRESSSAFTNTLASSSAATTASTSANKTTMKRVKKIKRNTPGPKKGKGREFIVDTDEDEAELSESGHIR